jgi:hypothetical protein
MLSPVWVVIMWDGRRDEDVARAAASEVTLPSMIYDYVMTTRQETTSFQSAKRHARLPSTCPSWESGDIFQAHAADKR